MSSTLNFIQSFFNERVIARYESPLNGNLEVCWSWGKKVLQAENANYSFQQLHEVWRKALTNAKLKESQINSTLNLGMGAGSTIQLLRKRRNINTPIISVEHDPIIIKIAKEHFGIDRYEDHEIVCDDAAEYCKASANNFDLILCDLFRDKFVPKKFLDEEFFRNVLALLKPNGKMIFNFMTTNNLNDSWKSVLKYLDTQNGNYRVIKLFSENQVLIYQAPI